MNKRFLEPEEMLVIATQHAYTAEFLLNQNAELKLDSNLTIDAIAPITTLMYQAIELTLKAYLIYENKPLQHCRSLKDLVLLNDDLGLSKRDLNLLGALAKHTSFKKGVCFPQWENRQQQQIFCEDIINLYARINEVMPLELHEDYK